MSPFLSPMTSETSLGNHWLDQRDVDQQGREGVGGRKQGKYGAGKYDCSAQVQGFFRAQSAVQEQRVLGGTSGEFCLHAGIGEVSDLEDLIQSTPWKYYTAWWELGGARGL